MVTVAAAEDGTVVLVAMAIAVAAQPARREGSSQ